ncbi:MAG: PspC domain-containing protein [Candidatus Micrarchaeia archaeon]|jgi:phage shock protein PspC (stress-responsive transcriptional regulator)
MAKAMKKLYRSSSNRVLGGVCGGLGEYFEIDPTVVRLGWVLLTFLAPPAGILGYIVAWLVMPKKR